MTTKYPGIPAVINGNGAIAHVMGHVCGGVIGYPITPSTEISELYEGFRASGGLNIWGRHPFFYEPEGEHSAQSGALGAALTGGKYVSNASSSQGIIYGIELHYVTVGKKVGGFVLHVAARAVSKHSLNVMAGHDDVYALLPAGYTILFGASPQETADLAAISYKVSALSLIPVANAMDGFATSHMMSEALLPEPELLKEFLGDPAGRIEAPTMAQEILFGAKGRVFQLKRWLAQKKDAIAAGESGSLQHWLESRASAVEADNDGTLIGETLRFIPEALRAQWRRQWLNAWEKGTRQRVPALVDTGNPGVTGGVQNQPDFQAGIADHQVHFAADVPRFVREAMADYAGLTGRAYAPVMPYRCEDAETAIVGLGSVACDLEAVVDHLRRQGRKVGSVAVKLLQPFPEAELAAALAGKRAITVLERSGVTALTGLVTQALSKARENANGAHHAGIPAIANPPKIVTAVFGLGGHDLQPRHLVAAFDNMDATDSAPFVYLGTQFFSKNPGPRLGEIQAKLKAAYPETAFMALETKDNPNLLPEGAFRVRFHSIGGYGTIATGKLLTDILAGLLNLYSKSAPKYGSEKSGAPTNFYITLSPEPVKITNAEIEDVEIAISPDHKVFAHSNPLRGLVPGGVFILQTGKTPLEAWRELPDEARKTIREKAIQFYVIDAFAVAKRHAPTPELQTRMMGIAFIGALCGNIGRIAAGSDRSAVLEKIREQIAAKFGGKGGAIVEGNMAVIREGLEATVKVAYDTPEFIAAGNGQEVKAKRTVDLSAAMCRIAKEDLAAGLFGREYYEDIAMRPFREGSIGEAPVLPGSGLFIPGGTGAMKDKGLFRRNVPSFDASKCTGCLECSLMCPDAALPSTVHEISDLLAAALEQTGTAGPRRAALEAKTGAIASAMRGIYIAANGYKALHDVFAEAAATATDGEADLAEGFARMTGALAAFPAVKTRLFFEQMEKKQPGSGGLYSVVLDPWKCSGCLECMAVCSSGALSQTVQTEAVLEKLQTRFEFLTKTANTPARFTGKLKGPNAKWLILDRENYYATTGGHGACRGCGEATAIRQVMAAAHAIHQKERKAEIAELEQLIAGLSEKLASTEDGSEAKARIGQTLNSPRKAPLPPRKRAVRSGGGGRGDRQRHRLLVGLFLDVPVHAVPRSMGQQPVPGCARRRQRRVRRHLRRCRGRLPRRAHCRVGAGRRLRSEEGWPQAPLFRLGTVQR